MSDTRTYCFQGQFSKTKDLAKQFYKERPQTKASCPMDKQNAICSRKLQGKCLDFQVLKQQVNITVVLFTWDPLSQCQRLYIDTF